MGEVASLNLVIPTIYFNFLDSAHFLHKPDRGLDKRICDDALI